MNKQTIKEELRKTEDEYEYRDEICDIGGFRQREQTVKIEHFVVQRSERGKGIAGTLLTALLEVLREDNVSTLTIKMGATEAYTIEELEEYRQETGEDDPTVQFLRSNGFGEENSLGLTPIEPIETHKWGLVFEATRRV